MMSQRYPVFSVFGISAIQLFLSSFCYAQTRQETVDFIFTQTTVLNDYGIASPDFLSNKKISEQGCIVTISGNVIQLNAANVINGPLTITIDFNKIIASATTFAVGNNNSLSVTMSGDDAAMIVKSPGFASFSPNYGKTVLRYSSVKVELSNLGNPQRGINAIKHFFSNFCTGKRSAF